MKKMLSVFLSLAMVFSLSCPVFAVGEIEYASSTEVAVLTPRSSLSLSFTNLPDGEAEYSDETYYISDENATLYINSCTWNAPTQDVRIGWYNVDTGKYYTVLYEGGIISNKGINSDGVPDGEYRVCVYNAGFKEIDGVLQYEVE